MILNFTSRVSFQEKLLFTKHLATMYKAGIPMTEALETLIAQTKSVTFKKILTGILADLDNGQTLAKALGKYNTVFDQFYVSLVEVSEQSGTLEENLEFLAKQLSKDFNLRKKIRAALLYPAIIVSLMLIVGGGISLFVLPKLVEFFKSFDTALPLPTKILLFISQGVKNYGIVILLSIVVLILIFRFVISIPKIKYYWHIFILKLPFIGGLVTYEQVSRFTRNFGVMIRCGVPISKSLEVTAGTLSNLKFKRDLEKILVSLTKGKNIGQSLSAKTYWEYPPIVSKMVSVGEKSGKLDEVLIYLSEFYDDEVDDLSHNFATVLEPFLLIIIGLAVGFVALAIISPIYELTGSIGK